jgi:transcriptional regulator with XRE-family HTH domain
LRARGAPLRAFQAPACHHFHVLKSATKALPQAASGRDYERIAVELVRAVRGPRSRARLSQRLGYRSNVVQRWESRRSFPTAARFLALRQKLDPERPSCFEAFFRRRPAWLEPAQPIDAEVVAAFLREVRGKIPLSVLATGARVSRHRIGRWLSGNAEPKLPEFLCLVDVATRRLPDFLATLTDPARLPSIARAWKQLCLAREAAYSQPWSHAVLRALELRELPTGRARQIEWIGERLGIGTAQVSAALGVLEQTDQVGRNRGGYSPREALVVNTAPDPERARELKSTWTRVALDRLDHAAPGNFGYALFAVSKQDMIKLRDLHLDYLRAMQQLIAASEPNECVGLYCAQLLDLGLRDNALLNLAGSAKRAPRSGAKSSASSSGSVR